MSRNRTNRTARPLHREDMGFPGSGGPEPVVYWPLLWTTYGGSTMFLELAKAGKYSWLLKNRAVQWHCLSFKGSIARKTNKLTGWQIKVAKKLEPTALRSSTKLALCKTGKWAEQNFPQKMYPIWICRGAVFRQAMSISVSSRHLLELLTLFGVLNCKLNATCSNKSPILEWKGESE